MSEAAAAAAAARRSSSAVQRRGGAKGSISGTLDELRFSHIFDYNAIEQIANGLERMVQSWSSRQEDRAKASVSVSVDKQAAAGAAAADHDKAVSCPKMNASGALQNYAEVVGFTERMKWDTQKMTAVTTEANEYVRPDESWLHKEYVKVGTYSVDKSPASNVSSLESGDKVTSPTRSSSPMKSILVKDGSTEKNYLGERNAGDGFLDEAKFSPTLSSERSLRTVDQILLDSSNEVEMQKLYVDVASSIERSFSHNDKESSASVEALSASGKPTRRPIEAEIGRGDKVSSESQADQEKEAMRNLCVVSDVEEFGGSFLQHNDDLLAMADDHDTFVTSPTYWRAEPEVFGTATTPKESSFVHDASYEKADFLTGFQERPPKRKKETNRSPKPETGRESFAEEAIGSGAFDLETLNGPANRCVEELQGTPSKSCASNLSLVEGEESKEFYKNKVEELQIALLECAAEYEVKMVEMEMKMLQLKSKAQHLGEQEPSAKPEKEWTARRLDNYRKHNLKLQREKEALSKEIMELKKKERQVGLLRKNLDDALQRVNSLQRDMVKKEEELVDSQLKEKESKAHLYQVEAALQQAEASRIDHDSVLSLLNSISQWLQNIKKASFVKFDPRQQLQVQQYEESLSKLMEEYLPQGSLPQVPSIGLVRYLDDNSAQADKSQDVKNDIQALQDELEKLACRRSTF